MMSQTIMKKEEISKVHASKKRNLTIVQKIARLPGENAAETEMTLTQIIDAQPVIQIEMNGITEYSECVAEVGHFECQKQVVWRYLYRYG